jgi:hypothetical protein
VACDPVLLALKRASPQTYAFLMGLALCPGLPAHRAA